MNNNIKNNKRHRQITFIILFEGSIRTLQHHEYAENIRESMNSVVVICLSSTSKSNDAQLEKEKALKKEEVKVSVIMKVR